jgi:hypothetical protein
VNAIGADATHATFDEARPHAAVDCAGIRTADDERPERTGGRRELGLVAVERDDRSLKAEPAECLTDVLEPCSDVCRPLQASGGGERAAELLTRLAERLRSTSRRDLLDQQRDQLGQAPVREFDPLELGRDAVDLGWTPSARPAPAPTPLGRDFEESGLDKPVEAAAGDIAMNTDHHGDVISGKRIAAAARVEQNPAKLGIAGRCEAIERHSGEKLPAAVSANALRI